MPQLVQYDPGSKPETDEFPVPPEIFAENPPELLSALHAAMETTDRDAIRYSTDCVQLRGKTGTLAATDGGQCLLQRGFNFPWEEDVLIRRTMVFGCKELPRNATVAIGRSDDWVTVRVGLWTIHLRIQKDGRFPQVDGVVPTAKGASASFRLPPGDRRFLGQAIPKLPCDDAYHSPITVELNGAVAIRAKSEETTPVTELILSGANLSGEPCRFQCNRRFLARAVQLGFDGLYVSSPKSPILCEDGQRSYVFAPLDPDSAIPPCDDAVRINGRDRYLGEYGSPQNHQEYERLVAEWRLASKTTVVPPAAKLVARRAEKADTVNSMILAYLKHAKRTTQTAMGICRGNTTKWSLPYGRSGDYTGERWSATSDR